jgi:hypothetical protein
MQNKLKILAAFIIFNFLFLHLCAQNALVDSLVRVVPSMKEDTNKVKTLIDIVWEYASDNRI